MNNETEHIPEAVFDWLDTSDFNALSEQEREEVLKYLSAEEYDQMRTCCQDIKAFSMPYQPQREESIKEALLGRFTEVHTKAAPAGVSKPSVFWHYTRMARKVAAILILFGAGWFCHYLVQFKKQGSQPATVVGDTVYLESAPVKIFDTVYLEKKKRNTPARSAKGIREQVIDGRDATSMVRPYVRDILAMRSEFVNTREANAAGNL